MCRFMIYYIDEGKIYVGDVMKSNKLLTQIVKFGFVGVVATIIDFSVLVFLTELFSVDVVASAGIAFCVSVIANYILSMKFVFESRNQSKVGEFFLFTVLSLGGLILNEAIMWLGVKEFLIHYIAVKIFATCFVMVYNFATRKIFLEKK